MKKLLFVLSAAVLTFLPLVALAPRTQAVDIDYYICLGINLGDREKCDEPVDPNDAENILKDAAENVIDVLSLIVGIVSVIMIIVGGLRYIISGGDSGNVTNAKNTILYAIVGLIIVLISRLIVNFIYARFK